MKEGEKVENEQRIAILEQEVIKLKDELAEKRKANVWKKIKNKYSEDFRSFNWTEIHNLTNCESNPIQLKKYLNEEYHISQAIGTLVRITLKKTAVNRLEETDEEKADNITKQILEIMKKEELKLENGILERSM